MSKLFLKNILTYFKEHFYCKRQKFKEISLIVDTLTGYYLLELFSKVEFYLMN